MAVGTNQVSVSTVVKICDLRSGETVTISNTGGTVATTPGATVVVLGTSNNVTTANGYPLVGSAQVTFSNPRTSPSTEIWGITSGTASIVGYLISTN